MSKKISGVKSKQFIGRDIFDGILKDILNFKTSTMQRIISLEKLTNELRSEGITLSNCVGALLDLEIDLSNLPKETVVKRFMQYMDDRSIITNEGKVRGEIEVNMYNFS